MSLSVSEQELISRAMESRLGDLYTALPGRIESYDVNTGTADVAPVITRPIATASGNIKAEDLPIVPNAIVCFPRGGDFYISWPLHKGDHVILLIMTYALAVWRKTGETSPPGDLRLHHLANAVAIPMLEPRHQEESYTGIDPLPEHMYLRGPLIILGDRNGSGYAALAKKVDDNFAQFKTAISSAAVAAGDGGATFKTNILSGLASIPSTACAQVKIK